MVPMAKEDEKRQFEQAKSIAMRLLARREHSKYELVQKLLQRDIGFAIAQQTALECERQNLLCEQRFATMLARNCIYKGQGPLRLQAEFKRHRLQIDIQRLCAELEINWRQQIETVYAKKYAGSSADSPKQKAKRQRFLYSRGFNSELIQSLWSKS